MVNFSLTKQIYTFSLVLLLWLVLAPTVYAQGYSVGPVADWVAEVKSPSDKGVAQQNNSDGVAYLLVDRQWSVGDDEQRTYEHYSSKALNSTGVTDISQISIDFDPVYESLTLHQVTVHRGNQSFNKLDSSKISLIQREKDLEYQIYDGSKTLNILIDDVRSGDRVEYSYTIEGANPVFNGHFSQQLYMAWSVPVGRLHYRVLWHSPRPLYLKNYLMTDNIIQKNVTGHTSEYIWQKDNLVELVSDKDTPSWYDPYPAVYLSDMSKWQDIANWARPLYKPVAKTPALNDVIQEVKNLADSDEKRILAALRFVQEEVRYLGIEMGENSHKPSLPDVVLQRRFGDCKDKSMLLVSLLKGLGIQASFAFVDTYESKWASSRLPTPSIFDHVIVLVNVSGKNYWLDPTRNFQNGSLDKLFQPDYGHALVVSDYDSRPVEMADADIVHSKKVLEHFDISGGVDVAAKYEIQSQYERYYADSLREDLSNTNLNELQQTYLNYTANYFPGVETGEALKVIDDKKLNRLTVDEFYQVKDIWQKSEDEPYLYATFEPFLFHEHIKTVSAPVRTMPLVVTHPVKYRHVSKIVVPKDSNFEAEYYEIKDSAFKFVKKVNFNGSILELDYSYESLSDHVSTENIKKHVENINELEELIFYQILMPDPAVNFGEYEFKRDDVNWFIVIVTLLSFVVFSYLVYRYIYLYDPLYRAPEVVNQKLEGLSGWLILVGLGVVVSPFNIFFSTQELLHVFSAQQWSMLEDQIGSAVMPLVVLEVMVNVVLLIGATFLVFMFFSRRHTFPRFYVMYLVFSLVVVSADTSALYLLSFPVETKDISNIVGLGVNVVIWGLYFKKSERVKATFTRQRKQHKQLIAELSTG